MNHSGLALIDPNKIFAKIKLGPGMRVADFGCGRTGHFVFMASREVGERGVVYALDILKDILESIRGRARSEGSENIQAVWTDLEKEGAAPIPEKSLDVGFFVNVFFLLKNKTAALREAARLLKDDGWLAVIDWEKKIGPLGPSPELMVKPDELAALAAAAGLRLAEKMPAGDYHFCLLFKKEKKV